MSARVFENQALDLTLTCTDNDGKIIDLTPYTVHFLTRYPGGNVDVDTTPTIADPTNGKVKHSYAKNVLTPAGSWMAKVLLSGTEVPSTRYDLVVCNRWHA